MNCQRFEDVVNDIAREQILDVSVRDEALTHSSDCEPCALRLEAELAMTLRLRSFAGSFESIGAPARVEAQLLAAFDNGSAVRSQPVVVSRPQYWPRYSLAAIAALLLIVFGFAVFRARQAAPVKEDPGDLTASKAGAPLTPVSDPLPPTTGDNPTSSPVSQKRPSTVRHNRAGATSITNQAKPKGPNGNSEIATDFMPVTYGGVSNLADGGRMVRVELPRSAMASFGLPVNMDRANERVKADVLLGVDGLAHAIRFVR